MCQDKKKTLFQIKISIFPSGLCWLCPATHVNWRIIQWFKNKEQQQKQCLARHVSFCSARSSYLPGTRSEMVQSLAWISAWTAVETSLYLKPCELTVFEQHDSLITLKPRCRKSAVEKPFIFFWHVGGSIVQIGFTDLSEKLWCC